MFGLDVGVLLFSVRLSIVTVAASLLALGVMIIHLPSVSIKVVRFTPLNRISSYIDGMTSKYMILESML